MALSLLLSPDREELPMTPAEIMATFERQGPLPRAAIEAARQEREAMVPVFLDYIDWSLAHHLAPPTCWAQRRNA